ncbi:hypothetical protein HDU91_006123 [Kappamyces sp. JEL0680]|nr:hypothetical protein HDU91_006123 [Kappamyces sp. JEL0680]
MTVPTDSHPTDIIVMQTAEPEQTDTSSTARIIEDPLQLKSYIVSAETLKELSGKKKGKDLVEFYTNQNDLIGSFLSRPEGDNRNEVELPEYKIAMYMSLSANVFLFGGQLTAAILSGSLALFATTLDAFMDLASNLVLLYTGLGCVSLNLDRFVKWSYAWTGHIASTHSPHEYPTGKTKYKTAGIIVFSTLMATLALQIWSESIQTLMKGSRDINIDWISLMIVGIGIGVKLLLFLYCQLFAHLPSVSILAQDHLNDVLFNSTGLLLSFLATKFYWWIDPVGAILIAFLIMRSWGSTALENIKLIVGITADPALLNRITYLALTHDPRILKVDTTRAYHSGYTVFVEVDIMLPPEMQLREAHDIGESLQVKLESLAEVDRAFVHLDWETTHEPEHQKNHHRRASTFAA